MPTSGEERKRRQELIDQEKFSFFSSFSQILISILLLYLNLYLHDLYPDEEDKNKFLDDASVTGCVKMMTTPGSRHV